MASTIRPFTRLYVRRMERRLEYRQAKHWTRDTIRELVRDGRLSPDVAKRWHRQYFKQPFVEPSQMGVTALVRDMWPLTLAILYIAYGGETVAIAEEWNGFIDWDQGLWLAARQPKQVMTIAEAERAIWTAFRTGRLGLLYPHPDGMKAIDRLTLMRLRWIQPRRDHRLSWDDDGVHVARDVDNIPFSHVAVDRAELERTGVWADAPQLAKDQPSMPTAASNSEANSELIRQPKPTGPKGDLCREIEVLMSQRVGADFSIHDLDRIPHKRLAVEFPVTNPATGRPPAEATYTKARDRVKARHSVGT